MMEHLRQSRSPGIRVQLTLWYTAIFSACGTLRNADSTNTEMRADVVNCDLLAASHARPARRWRAPPAQNVASWRQRSGDPETEPVAHVVWDAVATGAGAEATAGSRKAAT